MKKIINIKIFITILLGIFSPYFVSAQFSEQITDIVWDITPTTFSVVGGGRMVVSGIPSFKWQIEIGFPGDYFTNPDGSIEVNATGEPFKYLPVTPPFYSISDLQFQVSTNSWRFNLPSNFIGTLWPASNYYLDIVEWNPAETNANPVRDYAVFTTEPVSDLNLNIATSANGSTTFTLQVPAGVNVFNPYGGQANQGMPIEFNLLTEDRSGQQMTGNESVRIWSGSGIFNAQGSISVTVPSGIIDPSTTYYLKLINARAGAGRLPLYGTDLPILLNNPNPPSTNTGGSSTNPGTISSGQDFQGGLVNCSGPDCNFEKLLMLINRVVRFFIFVICIPIITLMFAYAGFMLLTSGGNPSKKEEAKGLILNAVTGLIILLAAWLIVRTVLVLFGYTGPLLGIMGI